MRSAERALLGFHRGAGVRASLRSTTIGVAVAIFAVGSSPAPLALLRAWALALASPGPGTAERAGAAALCLALAAAAARRATLGATGWMRSLPVSRIAARRAAAGASVVGQLAAVVALLAAMVVARTVYDAPLDAAKCATLALLVVAAGAAAVRVEVPAARVMAIVALGAAAWGTWMGAAASLAALVAWDRVAGGLAPPRRVSGRAPAVTRWETAARSPRRHRALGRLLAARLAWRAGGTRGVVDALPVALIVVAFAWLVRRNNPDLDARSAAAVGRAGAGVGVALLVALAANAMLARRAPWGWPRALPWSSADRVRIDAALLAAPALALSLGVMPFLGVGAAAAGAGAALVAGAAGAAALRRGAARQTGAAGEVALVAVPWAVLASMRPAAGWLAPALAAALLALAARRDRRDASSTRWSELRHGVAGDPAWLGGTDA